MSKHIRVEGLRRISRTKILRRRTLRIDLLYRRLPCLVVSHLIALVLRISRWAIALSRELVLLITWRARSLTRNRWMMDFPLLLLRTM